MLKRCITLRTDQEPTQAVAPNQGAAAFFCSTGILLLEESLRYFSISQQQAQRGKPIAFYNFLTGKLYFRLNRAETPFADVVLTGDKNASPP